MSLANAVAIFQAHEVDTDQRMGAGAIQGIAWDLLYASGSKPAELLSDACCVHRYINAIEAGYLAARTKQEEEWYDQQSERLHKRTHSLMQRWCAAYKVGPCPSTKCEYC